MLPPDLALLEDEAVYIFREAAGQLDRLALLFSGGKDSIVMAHLAQLAFSPARPPMFLLHIDTGHNFPETLEFRDRHAQRLGIELKIQRVEDSISRGSVAEENGPRPSRNAAQSVTLREAIAEYRLDGLFGGGRRDEEKARAKERIFSHRDRWGAWDPRNQRPEIWWLLNGNKHPGEHFRIFPLSNWTELDVWRYLEACQLEVPSLYFSHTRSVVQTPDGWLALGPWVQPLPGERVEKLPVRFRTIGDMTCTGAIPSSAASMTEVIREIQVSEFSERGTRADDLRSESAMEDRKRGGYF